MPKKKKFPFSCLLAEFCFEHSVNKEDLVKATGISRQTLRALERGTREPTLSTALTLAHYFKVSVEELFEPTSTNE